MKKLPYYFFCEDIDYRLTHKSELRHWLNQIVADHKREVKQVNYIFCTDIYLKQINKRFLRHNDYTDIITFDYSEDERIQSDIFISLERVRDNAITYKVSVADELHRVLAHGLLHLVGYKDKSPDEKALMTQKEEYYLSLRQF
jgi:probable rRNA maturation factor